MFYYYQIRNHHYKTETVPLVICPLCHTAGFMHMSVQQKYYWMIGPMAPSSKYAIAWCEHCNNYIAKVKWTNDMDNAYQLLKVGLHTPRRLYRGLFVFPLAIAAFIGIIMLVINLTDNHHANNAAAVKEAIAHPHTGDIFQILQSDGTHINYTYYKVTSAEGDKVSLSPSTVHKADMNGWDNVPLEANAYQPHEESFSISESAKDDMFLLQGDHPEYNMVYGVYKDGELIKKY